MTSARFAPIAVFALLMRLFLPQVALAATPTETATPTEAATPTETATPTLTPTQTETATPTVTATPTLVAIGTKSVTEPVIDGLPMTPSEYPGAVGTFEDHYGNPVEFFITWDLWAVYVGVRYDLGSPDSTHQIFLFFDVDHDGVWDSTDFSAGIARSAAGPGPLRVTYGFGNVQEIVGGSVAVYEGGSFFSAEWKIPHSAFAAGGASTPILNEAIGFNVRVSPGSGINAFWDGRKLSCGGGCYPYDTAVFGDLVLEGFVDAPAARWVNPPPTCVVYGPTPSTTPHPDQFEAVFAPIAWEAAGPNLYWTNLWWVDDDKVADGVQALGACAGGAKDGEICTVASECPGGTCVNCNALPSPDNVYRYCPSPLNGACCVESTCNACTPTHDCPLPASYSVGYASCSEDPTCPTRGACTAAISHIGYNAVGSAPFHPKRYSFAGYVDGLHTGDYSWTPIAHMTVCAPGTTCVGRACCGDGLCDWQLSPDGENENNCPDDCHCTPPPSGMIAWWPGDGNANDILGGNNGTLQGGATFGSGAVDQAFSLDGATAFVEVPDSDLWAFGASDFTIDLWANFTSADCGAVDQPRCVFIAQDKGPGAQDKWVFELGRLTQSGGTQNILHFAVNTQGAPSGDFIGKVPFDPQVGRWYHFAVTREAGFYTIYVDGALVSSESNATLIPNAAAPLRIGYAEATATFPGLLDEVEIFNRALAGTEIRAIVNAGSAGKCKGDTDRCSAVTCTALDDCHDRGTCDPSTGICSNPPSALGKPCPSDENPCTDDVCNGAGVCGVNNSAPCSDNNACTVGDQCSGGSCASGAPVVCTPLGQCYNAGCDTQTGLCSNPPKNAGAPCDDGTACTQPDQCNGAGVCVGGNPVVCTALDQCHNLGTCDTQTGVCSDPVKNDGDPCDDGNTCTLADQCTGGVCTGNSQTCGDGIVNTACGEECDLGPASADSGNCPPDASPPNCASCARSCSSDCKLIGRCTGTFGCCTAASDCPPGQGCCGNGIVENPPEQCDDGNLLPGDTCSPTCTTCTSPSCIPFTCCPPGAEVAGSTVAVRQKLKLMKLGPPVGDDKLRSPGETILLPGQDIHPCTEGVSYCLESDAGIVYGPNPVDVAHPAVPGSAFGPKPPCVDIMTPARQVRATFKDKAALVSEPDGIDRLQLKNIASQPNKYKHKVSGRNLDLSGGTGKTMLRQTLVVGDTCMTSSLTCVDKNATTKVCTPAP